MFPHFNRHHDVCVGTILPGTYLQHTISPNNNFVIVMMYEEMLSFWGLRGKLA